MRSRSWTPSPFAPCLRLCLGERCLKMDGIMALIPVSCCGRAESGVVSAWCRPPGSRLRPHGSSNPTTEESGRAEERPLTLYEV